MSVQSIISNNNYSLVNLLDESIIKDSSKLIKKLRFEIGKGITKEKQFNTLFLRQILCEGVCGLNKEDFRSLIDKVQGENILNTEDYL